MTAPANAVRLSTKKSESTVAVTDALQHTVEVTHAGFGTSKVKQVASNRRILDDAGKVRITRYTTCRDPLVRAEPEGVIDPDEPEAHSLDELPAVLTALEQRKTSGKQVFVPRSR